MAPQDALVSIAEISIGLAGFSGLVAAFVQHEGVPWRPDQKARIVLLVALSFGMIVCALAPFALAGISAAPAVIWGVPMTAFSVLTLALLLQWIILSRRYQFRLQFPLVSIPVLGAGVFLQVACLLSGTGVILPHSPALFVFGMLSVLLFGAIVFLALLNSIWK
jgi:hypothetical protein